MIDYNIEYETIRLELLKDKLDLHKVRQGKKGLLQLQKYNEALELRIQENTIQERLKTVKTQLLSDYTTLDLLPTNMLSKVIIDHLLAELQGADSTLPDKLHLLHQFLYSQQLEAINQNQKAKAEELAIDLKQITEAASLYKELLKIRS